MPRLWSFVKYWGPVLLWLALIYSASADQKSFHHSSRILEPIIRRLLPHLSDKTVHALVFGVRKCAHVAEYAILAMLVWRALLKPVKQDRRPWRWGPAAAALAFVALYAATDEWHQSFVPNRQGSVSDVLLDTCGGALGLLLIWIVWRWSLRRPTDETASINPDITG